jgi:hypothetical protein
MRASPNFNAKLAFDFSAFFDSPGLEILRTKPRISQPVVDKYFCNWNWESPSYDWLEEQEDSIFSPPIVKGNNINIPSDTTKRDGFTFISLGEFKDQFETPVRSTGRWVSMGSAVSDIWGRTGGPEIKSSSGRRIRGIDEMDACQFQHFAFLIQFLSFVLQGEKWLKKPGK